MILDKKCMDRVKVFGIKINTISKLEYLSWIEQSISGGKRIVQNGINAALIVESSKNERLMASINNSDLVNIDGMAVVWALRLLGYKVSERVPCPDLADDLMSLAEKRNFSVFLLGASDKSLGLCVKRLLSIYPSLRISGYRNGYFSAEEESSVVQKINEANPDILLLGMPSPKKEFFIETYRDRISIRYSLGVGGYFDIVSSTTRRAPRWLQKMGLEWAYRLIQEPRRMWRRYLIGNVEFIIIIIKEIIFKIKPLWKN